jgi:uncharacterized membrane protein
MQSNKPRHWVLSGLFLGLADGVKQTPWMIIAFLWLWLAREKRMDALRYFTIAWFLAFIVPNLPFMVYPSIHTAFPAWLKGTLLPALVPDFSQGAGLALLNLGIWSVTHSVMTLMTIAWVLALLIAYLFVGRDGRWSAWVIPTMIYLVTYRSLANYFVYFIPIAFYIVMLLEKAKGELW